MVKHSKVLRDFCGRSLRRACALGGRASVIQLSGRKVTEPKDSSGTKNQLSTASSWLADKL